MSRTKTELSMDERMDFVKNRKESDAAKELRLHKWRVHESAVVWSADTEYTADEFLAEYENYVLVAHEDIDGENDPLTLESWAEEIKGIPN